MKKLILLLIFFLILLFIPKNIDSKMVMSEIDNNTCYEFDFNNEILTFRNFKLKLGLFTSYDYNITKVYIKYNEKIKDELKYKEYFSFDSTNFNRGIETLKEEYIILLKNNNLYDELDKDIDETVIDKIEIYTNEEALNKFKNKYPSVDIKKLR